MESVHHLGLGDVLESHGRYRAASIAAVCGSNRLTYAELNDRAGRLAAALAAEGLKHGDRVMWLGQNCHRAFEAFLATARLGGVFCPVNWRAQAPEIAFLLGDFEPHHVIWQQEELGDLVDDVRSTADSGIQWVQHDGTGPGSYEELIATTPRESEGDVDWDSPVLQIYSSAYEGTPNGVQISHRVILVRSIVMAMHQRLGRDYVYLNCGPMFHVGTLIGTLTAFQLGGTNVFLPKMDTEEVCRLIDAEHCNGAFIFEPTISSIVEFNSDGRFNLKSLRAMSGRPEWNEMVTVDPRWGSGYGQTEMFGSLTQDDTGGGAVGPHGWPVPGMQLRILDAHGTESPVGEIGEIAARGPLLMNGYWRRPDLNATRMAGGWYRTNDFGRIESDGSLTFIGPKGRLIKSGLENVYPAEVEMCIKEHPGVQECGVIGYPHPKWFQSVRAIVVLRPGATATEEEIVDHCKDRIASYKKPTSVVFVERMPRKGFAIDYEALDELYDGGGYPGGTTGPLIPAKGDSQTTQGAQR
jgi:long-chain acyl-CoA synthetase